MRNLNEFVARTGIKKGSTKWGDSASLRVKSKHLSRVADILQSFAAKGWSNAVGDARLPVCMPRGIHSALWLSEEGQQQQPSCPDKACHALDSVQGLQMRESPAITGPKKIYVELTLS